MKKSLLVGLAILAVILGATAPSDARGRGGHGGHRFSGGHHGGHHHFHGRGPVFVGVGPSFFWGPPPWWYYPPAYVAPVVVTPPPVYVQPSPPPVYWYYCRCYGAYYPNVRSCLEPWVPVPATP